MNPFAHIDPDTGLQQNTQSPYYGRYDTLRFDQVWPQSNLPGDTAFIPFKPEANEIWEEVKDLYASWPGAIHGMMHLVPADEAKRLEWDPGDDDPFCFLQLYMPMDKVYMAMENFYFAMDQMALFLEDCQFFMYPMIGGLHALDRWIDQYMIRDGSLVMSRHQWDSTFDNGRHTTATLRLLFYMEKALQNPGDAPFIRFTQHQVEDSFNAKDFFNSKDASSVYYKIARGYKQLCNMG